MLGSELGAVPQPTGTTLAGGVEWTTTTGRRQEAAWVRTDGDVTFLITGSASPDDFQTLATAAAAGSVVPG